MSCGVVTIGKPVTGKVFIGSPMCGKDIDVRHEIKNIIRDLWDMQYLDDSDINLSVTRFVLPEMQEERFAFGYNFNGEEYFIFSPDDGTWKASSVFAPVGVAEGNEYVITQSEVTQTSEFEEWIFEAMDAHGYMYSLLTDAQTAQIIGYLKQMVGQRLEYAQIFHDDE